MKDVVSVLFYRGRGRGGFFLYRKVWKPRLSFEYVYFGHVFRTSFARLSRLSHVYMYFLLALCTKLGFRSWSHVSTRGLLLLALSSYPDFALTQQQPLGTGKCEKKDRRPSPHAQCWTRCHLAVVRKKSPRRFSW